MTVERNLVVSNDHGLHARPAMALVDLANRFSCNLTVVRPEQTSPEGEAMDEVEADAKSVMAVITLAATKGTRLKVIADGDDAEPAADAIAALFESKFGEDD